MAPVEAFWERAGKTSSPRITIVKAWIRSGIWASHFSEASAYLSGNASTTQRSLRTIKKNVCASLILARNAVNIIHIATMLSATYVA
jgi:hypothetical protein